MLKYSKPQVKEKVVQIWSIAFVFVMCAVVPYLPIILGECTGTGSGAGCSG